MKLTRSDTIGIAGMSFLFFNVLYQTVIFPSILKSEIKKRVALKNGSPMRKTWSKLPFSFEHHWYIFNITNPNEIAKGKKPKVREVGPFVYDVWQEKINQVDQEEDDTLTYSLKNTYFFNEEKSKGLDDDYEIMMPHLFMLAIPNGLMRDRPFLMPIASRAVDSVMMNPQSMFVPTKAKILLFDGFPIECEGIEDFHGKVLCNEMRDNYDSYFLMKVGEKSYANSLWGSFNGTDRSGKKLRIRRGTKNLEELGKVVEFNHKKNFSAWTTDYCNAFYGTDYTIFPPFLDKKGKDKFFSIHPLMCRSFEFNYDSNVQYEGLKLLRYTTYIGADGQSNPQHKCYCLDPSQCLRDGVFDLYKCLNVPLILSHPHFYLADPYYSQSVEGLKPNKEKHMMLIDIDPLTALAVRVNVRVQISLTIMPLKKYRLMETFADALLPLVWFDQQTVVPSLIIKQIKACHRILMILNVVNYLTLMSGLGMCGYAGYHQYKSRREKKLNVIVDMSQENSVNHSRDERKMPSIAMPANIE